MRIFVFLFSVYILSLSVMPCTDKEEGNYLSEQTAGNFATTHHDNQEQDAEHCPPFCVCTCCGQVFHSDCCQSTAYVTPHIPQQYFPACTSSLLPEVCFNIWQPPKIS